MHSKKNTEPKFGLNMDKQKCWVKNVISNFNPTSTFNILIAFLTQHLGLSIFYPNLGSNNPALFRVYHHCITTIPFSKGNCKYIF